MGNFSLVFYSHISEVFIHSIFLNITLADALLKSFPHPTDALTCPKYNSSANIPPRDISINVENSSFVPWKLSSDSLLVEPFLFPLGIIETLWIFYYTLSVYSKLEHTMLHVLLFESNL
jgi:hypothetical protein